MHYCYSVVFFCPLITNLWAFILRAIIDEYDLKIIKFPSVVTKRIQHSKGLTAYNDIYHGDSVQLIDNKWLHFINGSNCAKIPGKEKLVDKMIDNIEKLYFAMKKAKR